MFGSTVLEVATGLVFVFLLVSLVCSGISDRISDIFNWRAEHLENGIRDLLLGGDQKLLNKLYNNQVIQSLSTVAAEKLHRTPPATSVQVSAAQPQDPTILTPKSFPINIPKRTFVLALFNAFVPGSSGQNTLDGLRASIDAMPDSAVKRELLTLVTDADTTVDGARKNVEQWFNAAEDEMTRLYKQKMWLVSLVIGFLVSIVLNVDTTAIANNLWHDPTLRSAIVAQATQYASQNNAPTGAISQAVDQINGLNLPIGWGTLKPGTTNYGQCLLFFNACVGPSDWLNWGPVSDNAIVRWLGSALVKLLGWVITAFAGAQGAPFWFDILRKLTNKGSPAA